MFERRLAETIARAIELDIIQRDLEPGTLIGSEADLMQRFDASRGVIREAVCLVESRMLAETRRGVGGGLIVAEPAGGVVEDIVSLFLARKKATEFELLEARLALELLALRNTIANLDQDGRNVLEEERTRSLLPNENVAASSQRFHNLLGQLSANAVLELFIPTMTALVEEMWVPPKRLTKKLREETWAGVSHEHAEIITRMLEGDVHGAERHLSAHLEGIMSILRKGTRKVVVKRLA
jgi:DNA-binding FadR family transcriptional regulator